MKRVATAAAAGLIAAFAAIPPGTAAGAESALPIGIVAAENFYGDVARQVGGDRVSVTSILSNPDEDPHLFEASPAAARALVAARIVVSNGLGYDPWVDKLLHTGSGSAGGPRASIVVGALTGRRAGDNPHIWYDPPTMPALAAALVAALSAIDPAGRAAFQQRLARFRQSLRPLDEQIAMLRERLAASPVAATEPVFGYMLAALGMRVKEARFQLAVMNDTEPSASDIAGFEDDLRRREVALLIYNRQATDPTAQRMADIAKSAGVPVVGVSETEPPGVTYQAWISGELDAIDRALPPHSAR